MQQKNVMFILIEKDKNKFRMIGNNLGTIYYLCSRTKSINYESYSIHS